MHVSDDLFLGNFFGTQSLTLFKTSQGNPTIQDGVGPMGRVTYYNIVPLTLQTANIAALAAPSSGIAMTLRAGTGVTAVSAPDGSGATVYQFDVPRAVSLTSTSDVHTVNYTIVGYDYYGQKMTQTLAGPNINTVNTTKAFYSVLSVTPSGSNAGTVSVGSSDIFGLPFFIGDAGYVTSTAWNNTLGNDAGTLVNGDTTSPATASTGDVRGTYKPSANASNGSRRLIIGMHLNAGQCGSSPTITNLLGQPQV